MPELPEVETVRRGLAPVMEGARFARVELRRPDLRFPFPENFARRVQGAEVLALGRRGKYLTATLSTGETLVMHLGMSGRFTVEDRQEIGALRRYGRGVDPRHDHVVFEVTQAGSRRRIVYNDPRRFGFMDLVATGEIGKSRHFAGMGPEPLSDDFTPAGFEAELRARAAPIKSVLLDQTVVAGIGNIYACEALFRAGLSPRRSARSTAGKRARRLHGAIREVLSEAIEAGGSSLRDFAASDGRLGYFQHSFKVYAREGAPCPVCGAPVRRLLQAGRATFHCRSCQR